MKNKKSKIPASYNIDAAKMRCVENGFKARECIVWFKEGRLETTSAINIRDSEPPWPEGARLGRCVEFYNGTRWAIIDPEVVGASLVASLEDEAPLTSFLPPSEDYYDRSFPGFDRDLAKGVWMGENPSLIRPRCAELKEVATYRISKIQTELDREPAGLKDEDANEIEHLLKTANRILHNLDEMLYVESLKPTPDLDPAIALRQGWRLGLAVAEAGALLGYARLRGLDLRAGHRKGDFWKWVLNHPDFQHLSSKEVALALDGKKDPEHATSKIRVDFSKGIIVRGNKKTLKLSSFESRLRSQRARSKSDA